jgi:hypothetical protein
MRAIKLLSLLILQVLCVFLFSEALAQARDVSDKSESTLTDARTLLEQAASKAESVNPVLRTVLYIELANSYSRTDKTKARNYLRASFDSVALIEDDENMQSRLISHIISGLLAFGPQELEALVDRSHGKTKNEILKALAAEYAKQADFERAADAVSQITAASEFPYSTAVRVMESLPVEKVKSNVHASAWKL